MQISETEESDAERTLYYYFTCRWIGSAKYDDVDSSVNIAVMELLMKWSAVEEIAREKREEIAKRLNSASKLFKTPYLASLTNANSSLRFQKRLIDTLRRIRYQIHICVLH